MFVKIYEFRSDILHTVAAPKQQTKIEGGIRFKLLLTYGMNIQRKNAFKWFKQDYPS